MNHPTNLTVRVDDGTAAFVTLSPTQAQLIVQNTVGPSDAVREWRLQEALQKLCKDELRRHLATFRALLKEFRRLLPCEDGAFEFTSERLEDGPIHRAWFASPSHTWLGEGSYDANFTIETDVLAPELQVIKEIFVKLFFDRRRFVEQYYWELRDVIRLREELN